MSALRPETGAEWVAQGGRYPTQRHFCGLGANICWRSDLQTGAEWLPDRGAGPELIP